MWQLRLSDNSLAHPQTWRCLVQVLKCPIHCGRKQYFTWFTLLLMFCVLKIKRREVKIKFRILLSRFTEEPGSKHARHHRINLDNCDVYVGTNKGDCCCNCTVWYTLITVWMVEGREAGVVMTAPLSQQLSLPWWKRLESTVKNASEIYRPAVGLCIREGETWKLPSGRGPSLRLHG